MSRLDSVYYRRYQEEQDARQDAERIDVGVIARRAARRNAAPAPLTRKIQDKRRKAPKHRKPLRGEE